MLDAGWQGIQRDARRATDEQLFLARVANIEWPEMLELIDSEINQRFEDANPDKLIELYELAARIMGAGPEDNNLVIRKKRQPPPPPMFLVKILQFLRLV